MEPLLRVLSNLRMGWFVKGRPCFLSRVINFLPTWRKGWQRLPVSWLSQTHKEPLSARDPSEAATDLAASFLLRGNTVWGCSQHEEGGTKTPCVSWGHHWALLYHPWSPPHHTPWNFPLLFKPVCEGFSVICWQKYPDTASQRLLVNTHLETNDLENSLFF